MKIKCSIIQDLLPSYIDNLTSKESNNLIESHIEECENCKEKLTAMSTIIQTNDEEVTPPNINELKIIKRIKKRLRIVFSILIITFLVIGISVGVFGNILFQEGNPLPLINSIIALEINNSQYEQFSDNPIKYVSINSSQQEELILDYMVDKGWEYIEQNGNSYFFSRGEEEVFVETNQFTKRYFIWKVPFESTRNE